MTSKKKAQYMAEGTRALFNFRVKKTNKAMKAGTVFKHNLTDWTTVQEVTELQNLMNNRANGKVMISLQTQVAGLVK